MGYWVNKDSYSGGKRHYYEDGAQNVTLDYVTERGVKHWNVTTYGFSLCGRSISNTMLTWYSEFSGKEKRSGGLSYRKDSDVKLTQSNLCSYCRAKYIESRPELKEALKALGVY